MRLLRPHLTLALAFAAALLCRPMHAATGATPSLVFTHVTVIDPRDGSRMANLTVTIQGSRIVSVQPDAKGPWPGAVVVDAHGKYLIPGLWDMEVHLSWCGPTSLPLLVANGVTSVRDMGGDFRQIEAWKTQIASGQLTGPHILQVGPMLNGKSYNPFQLVTGNPDQTRAVVRTLKFLGVDGLEVERRIPKDSYEALLDQAKQDHLPLGGHVPLAVSPEEASNDGQSTIENIESLYYGTFAEKTGEKDLPAAINLFLSSGSASQLFHLFVQNHTAVTPVLSALQTVVNLSAPNATPGPEYRYIPLSLRQGLTKSGLSAADLAGLQAELPEYRKTVRLMQQDGVLLLAGTDIAGPRVPGFSLHRELQQLVASGLTPLQALQAATINPAIELHQTALYGSIEPGKAADMLLLDADPLVDIANTQRIAAIIHDGQYIDRSTLDKLLQSAEQQAAKL